MASAPVAARQGLGGGVYIAAGTANFHHTVVTGNAAKGGAGGTFFVAAYTGRPGQGIGGGVYIGAAAWLGLDSYSLRNCKANKATTMSNDIAGI